MLGRESPSQTIQERLVGHFSVQLSVQWLPWQHCQDREPPAEQQRGPAGKKVSDTEVRGVEVEFSSNLIQQSVNSTLKVLIKISFVQMYRSIISIIYLS